MDELEQFRSLVARLRAGDPAAAADLCREYGPYLRLAVRRKLHHHMRQRFDSLDFVQDVWTSVLALPPDRYTFDSPDDLIRFLTAVANHKVIEGYRRVFEYQKGDIRREWPDGKAGAAGGAAGVDNTPDPAASPSQWLIAEERWEHLLRHCPPGHRAILKMLRDGHSVDDIAWKANVSPSTISRVVRRLKDVSGL